MRHELTSCDDLPDPRAMRELLERVSGRVSHRIEEEADVRLVESINDADLDATVEIDKAAFHPSQWYAKDERRRRLAENRHPVLILVRTARDNVAFASRYHSRSWDPKTYFLDELAIKPPYQRKGIGPLLMKLTIIIAHQLGYRRLRLFSESVNDQGVNLDRYYTRLGFTVGEETTHMAVTEDLVERLTTDIVTGGTTAE